MRQAGQQHINPIIEESKLLEENKLLGPFTHNEMKRRSMNLGSINTVPSCVLPRALVGSTDARWGFRTRFQCAKI